MGFRCNICHQPQRAGTALSRYTVYHNWTDNYGRQRKDVVREVNVCSRCLEELKGGATMLQLAERYGPASIDPPEPLKPKVKPAHVFNKVVDLGEDVDDISDL